MKVLVGCIMLLGITSAVAGISDKKIRCYIGTDANADFNTTGVMAVSLKDKTACSVTTIVGVVGAVRNGISAAVAPLMCVETITNTCTGEGYSKCVKATTNMCYCKTDLCNNAPATTAALMSIIAMALIAKFMI